MPEILIQPVSVMQAGLLAEIHLESFGTSAWNSGQISGTLALETTQGWITFDKEEPTGFILCQIMPDQTEILTFCVRPSHRQKGIGEKLLLHVLGLSRGGEVFLEVAADNPAAINLYKKLCFQQTGKRPHYYHRGTTQVDALLFTHV